MEAVKSLIITSFGRYLQINNQNILGILGALLTPLKSWPLRGGYDRFASIIVQLGLGLKLNTKIG